MAEKRAAEAEDEQLKAEEDSQAARAELHSLLHGQGLTPALQPVVVGALACMNSHLCTGSVRVVLAICSASHDSAGGDRASRVVAKPSGLQK